MSQPETKKHIVISLHGIRTRGEWQKLLAEHLSANDMIPVSADYGTLSLGGFFLSATFGGRIEWFRKKYEEVILKYADHLVDGGLRRYPSLVAHSFGTFIACLSMKKYEEIRFEKMIICASILPENFPWELLFERDQVSWVSHEYGAKDIWTTLCGSIIPNTGLSGAKGFSLRAPIFYQNRYDEYKHSDFFSAAHIKEIWIPLLERRHDPYTIKNGREIRTQDEFNGIINQALAIDAKVYGNIPEYQEVSPSAELAAEWLGVEPDFFTFLIDQRQQACVGYITGLFVKPEAFDKILARGMVDREMVPEVLASSHDGDPVCMCALSIAIDPGLRVPGEGYHSPLAYKLLGGVCWKLEYLARHRGVQVKELAAVGWTDEGKRICKNILGMDEEGSDRFLHPIFRLKINEEILLRRKKKPFGPLLRVARLYQELGWN